MAALHSTKSEIFKKTLSCHTLRKTKSCPEFSLPEQHNINNYPELFLEEDVQVPRLTLWMFIDENLTNDLLQSNKEEALLILCCCLKWKGLSGLNLKFMKLYLCNALSWALEQEFDAKKVSCFLGILLNTHTYFLASPDRNQLETYKFCRECLVLHSIEYPPKADRILKAFESRDCLLYFCEMYLPMLPLLRVSLLPNYRLEINWNVPSPSELQESHRRSQRLKSSKRSTVQQI